MRVIIVKYVMIEIVIIFHQTVQKIMNMDNIIKIIILIQELNNMKKKFILENKIVIKIIIYILKIIIKLIIIIIKTI